MIRNCLCLGAFVAILSGLSGLGINIYSSHLRKIPADTRWQIC